MSLSAALHEALRPTSVGPAADMRAVLSWRLLAGQRWRWVREQDQNLSLPSMPLRVGRYRGEHSHSPRKADKIIVFGRFGVILYINHSEQEAMIRVWEGKSYTDQMHDIGLIETNLGNRIPWRIEG